MRIVVASQQRSTREAVGMLIRAQPDFELAAGVSDIADLVAKIKAERPELVVLDWDELGQRIETLLDLLELIDEPPKIVALSVHEEARAEALAWGVAGFAFKGDPPDGLLQTIRDSWQRRDSDSTE